ncbi:hypothetical protein CDV55_106616 [Aspergillus turcosus]|uniref:Major facilitator superfamily (MFS) profile domain-containing protein n=1 Tax=Aspergillus turcosus TaxID=1245748 RepID=A0A397HQZ0_9EURO|nr:hypothetical protein CDV55_106616 [Aspergillus turcosus]RLL99106.1 hypothetical protein CFD26_102864 [Aspergillus turcosus]
MTTFQGISLHVTVYIDPANLPTFWKAFKPVYEQVIEEPECTFFEVYQGPENLGTLTWVENWSKPKEWFAEVQANKPYYKDYLAATMPLYLKPREIKVLNRVGAPFGLTVGILTVVGVMFHERDIISQALIHRYALAGYRDRTHSSTMRLSEYNFRGKALITAITMASCQAFLLIGFDQGVMSGIIGAQNRFGRDFNNPDAAMQGNITALYDIGCVVGSIVSTSSGSRSDAARCSWLAGRSWWDGDSRLIVYDRAAYRRPHHHRDRERDELVDGAGGTVTILGVMIAYCFIESSFQWRFPSPSIQHDRHEEARAVIAAIEDKPLADETVSRTVLDIQTGLEEEQRGGPFRFAELFTRGETQNLRRLLLTISIELGQQLTRSNMINYYAPRLRQCTYLVGSAIPVLLMDRFGRRTLLMVCSAGLCLCFVRVSILLSLDREGAAYGATAFIFVFQLFYGVGWLPVPWFYPAEINTTRVRTKMQAIASGWNGWLFCGGEDYPGCVCKYRMENFAVLNAVFIPMVYCFYPETKGLELEDIPLLFAKGGVTGVLTSKGGRTVAPGQHARDVQVDRKVEVQEIETAA